MHAYMHLMTKVISLSDEAYNDLVDLKTKGESFSDIVKRITKDVKKKKLMELAGAWKDAPEMDRIFKGILEERHKYKGRGIRL